MSISLSLSVSESNVNTNDNTSKVTVSLKLKSTVGAYNGYSSSGYITIDGTRYNFSHGFNANTTTTLATKSKTITHNADGSKSITIKGSYSPGSPWGTKSVSRTFTLTKINRQYTVTLNTQGGSVSKTSLTKTYNVNLALPTPTKLGYNFGGWWTGTGGTGTNYNKLYTANKTITLHAKWTAITYTVKVYNYNGSSLLRTLTKTYGTGLNLGAISSIPAGRIFMGWHTQAQSIDLTIPSVTVARDNTYNTNAAATFYEVFAINTYAVTYNANGGSGSIVSTGGKYGESITLSNGENFSRQSYALAGWNTQQDGSGTTYSLGQKITVTSDMTLYAIWGQAYISPQITIGEVYRRDSRGIRSAAGSEIYWNYSWTAAKKAGIVSNRTVISGLGGDTFENQSNGEREGTENGISGLQTYTITITDQGTNITREQSEVYETSVDLVFPAQESLELSSNITRFIIQRSEENVRTLNFEAIISVPYDGENYFSTSESLSYIKLIGTKTHFDTDSGTFEEAQDLLVEENFEIDVVDNNTNSYDDNGFIHCHGTIQNFTLDYVLKDVKIKVCTTLNNETNEIELQNTIATEGIMDMSGIVIGMGKISVHIPGDQRGISLFGFLLKDESGLVLNEKATFKDELLVTSNATINNNLNINKTLNLYSEKKSSAWWNARDNAIINFNTTPILNSSGNIMSPLLSTKTTQGDWSICTFDHTNEKYNGLWFSYVKDSDYSNQNNIHNVFRISTNGQVYNNKNFVVEPGANIDQGFQVDGSQQSIRFTIGTSNNNRGIIDVKKNRWIVYATDNSNTVTSSRGRPNQTAISHTTTLGNQVIVPPEWKFRANGVELWNGGSNGYYMTDSQQVRFSTNARYFNGIVLVWSQYTVNTSTAENYGWQYVFIPRWHIENRNGAGVRMELKHSNTDAILTCIKYVYIYDDRILGNNENGNNGTNYDNRAMVLRAVIGV